jgi:hypothetical protein
MKLVDSVLTNQNNAAVYVKLVFEDADGKRFYFRASCFKFDLTPEQEGK